MRQATAIPTDTLEACHDTLLGIIRTPERYSVTTRRAATMELCALALAAVDAGFRHWTVPASSLYQA